MEISMQIVMLETQPIRDMPTSYVSANSYEEMLKIISYYERILNAYAYSIEKRKKYQLPKYSFVDFYVDDNYFAYYIPTDPKYYDKISKKYQIDGGYIKIPLKGKVYTLPLLNFPNNTKLRIVVIR
jgi:hypothetical protein